MAWLERRQGCRAGDDTCWGPVGDYWTFFGNELQFLWLHAAAASILVAAALGVALWLRRRRGWPVHWGWLAGGALLAMPLVFILLAALFPLYVVY